MLAVFQTISVWPSCLTIFYFFKQNLENWIQIVGNVADNQITIFYLFQFLSRTIFFVLKMWCWTFLVFGKKSHKWQHFNGAVNWLAKLSVSLTMALLCECRHCSLTRCWYTVLEATITCSKFLSVAKIV